MNRSIKEIMNEQLKKQSQISEKQKAVLNSATVLFSERGFYNTSTKDIARMAKVSEGTVYKHFKTKNELLYAGLLPLYKSVVAPEVLKEFSSELSKCDNLDAFIDTFVDNRIKFIDNNKNIIPNKIVFSINIVIPPSYICSNLFYRHIYFCLLLLHLLYCILLFLNYIYKLRSRSAPNIC